MAADGETRARVVVGGTFACDDALARPLDALLGTVIGDGAVHVDWLSYGSVSELSQWLHVAAPESAGRTNARSADLVVLLVRVSDLEAAHPELLESTANGQVDDSGEDSAERSPVLLDVLARDLETYAALDRERPPVVVLFCPPPPLVAERHAHLELRVIQRLGTSASRVVEVFPSSRLLDLFEWHYGDLDKAEYFDVVGDHREHAPFTWRMLRVLALAVCRHVRRVFVSPAQAKKCVVLDCDNTLWGGAVAEVGALALDLSPRFLALQRFVVELQRARGFVLCLCSKNIQEDVDAAFRERREDMPLRVDEHIAAVRINWAPKSRNIRAIADELSLGLDSFVLIDDNPVECSEVASALPSVSVIRLPADFTPSFLHHEWLFDTPLRRVHASEGASPLPTASSTEEDRERTRFYQQNHDRERLRHEAASHTAFLSSLGVRIEFEELSPSANANIGDQHARAQTMTRVLQLLHRTNQFSTSTTFSKRLESRMLDEYVARSGRFVLCARVTDRFGHYGLVSAALCRQVIDDDSSALHVDSFLLSCRALNRGVEHAMIRKLAGIARRAGATRIRFDWEPTERNQPAQLFFASMPDAALTYDARRDADTKSARFANAQLLPGVRLGQWELPVEAASGVAFLKTDSSNAASPPNDYLAKPLAPQNASSLMAFTARVLSWAAPKRDALYALIARLLRILVHQLLPRRLSAMMLVALNKREAREDSGQSSAQTPFRTRGSLDRFLLPKMQAQDDRNRDRAAQTGASSMASIDRDEISKFRRKARHRTKVALLSHLHEETPAIVWSANRGVDAGIETAAAAVAMTCGTPSCSTRVARESVCAFRRCRNCCYRIQRLVHRASSSDAHVTAKATAQRALSEDFDLSTHQVANLIANKQQLHEEDHDGICPAHRNKRRIR